MHVFALRCAVALLVTLTSSIAWASEEVADEDTPSFIVLQIEDPLHPALTAVPEQRAWVARETTAAFARAFGEHYRVVADAPPDGGVATYVVTLAMEVDAHAILITLTFAQPLNVLVVPIAEEHVFPMSDGFPEDGIRAFLEDAAVLFSRLSRATEQSVFVPLHSVSEREGQKTSEGDPTEPELPAPEPIVAAPASVSPEPITDAHAAEDVPQSPVARADADDATFHLAWWEITGWSTVAIGAAALAYGMWQTTELYDAGETYRTVRIQREAYDARRRGEAAAPRALGGYVSGVVCAAGGSALLIAGYSFDAFSGE